MYDDKLKQTCLNVLRAAFQKSNGTGSIVSLAQVNELTPVEANTFKQVLAECVAENHVFRVVAQDIIFLTPQGRDLAATLPPIEPLAATDEPPAPKL